MRGAVVLDTCDNKFLFFYQCTRSSEAKLFHVLLNHRRISGTVDATLWEKIGSYVIRSRIMRTVGVLLMVTLVPVRQVRMVPVKVSEFRKGSFISNHLTREEVLLSLHLLSAIKFRTAVPCVIKEVNIV